MAPLAQSLHAAGAAGFQRPQRRVQPDVRALHQVARHSPCRSLPETPGGAGTRAARARWTICWINSLPASSRGCALPAKMICTGRSGWLRMRLQPLHVAQHQRGPLVGGEAAREADGQGVRVQHFVGRVDVRLRRAATLQLGAQVAAREGHQPLPAALVGAPQFLAPEWPPRAARSWRRRVPRASSGPGSGRRAGSSRAKSRSGSARRW